MCTVSGPFSHELVVQVEEVRCHLEKHGLITKLLKLLNGGSTQAQVAEDIGELVYWRGNRIPLLVDKLNKQELFSTCGTLVGHYWMVEGCMQLYKGTGRDKMGQLSE